MVAAVWEAVRGMHQPGKSQAKRPVKGGKIRGIKIAPTQHVLGASVRADTSAVLRSPWYTTWCVNRACSIAVKNTDRSLHFEIFKEHILEQSRLFQASESHHSSQLPESELQPPLNLFLYTSYFKCGTELKRTPKKMEVALTWNVWYFRRKNGRLTGSQGEPLIGTI